MRLEHATGLSRGAIFNYFDSKEDLFIELAARDNERLVHLWIEKGWEAALRDVVDEDADWIGVYMEIGRRIRTDPALRGSHAGVARSPASRARPRRAETWCLPRGRARGADRWIHRTRCERDRCSARDRGADPKRRRVDRVRPLRRYRPSSDRYASAYTLLTRSTSFTYLLVSGKAIPAPSARQRSTFPWPAWYAASTSLVSS